MPNITAGNVISSSTQLGTDTVTLPAMANDSIDASNIKTSAVGTDEILDGEIVNADISPSAAIADSKLAQITTASKVSGAAITSLDQIPAGAGVIPAVNLSGSKIAKGTADVNITNTSAETTLLTESIAGGLLGTINGILLRASVTFQWTSQGSYQLIRIKYGATTVATFTYDPVSSVSQTATVDVNVLILAGTATNAQDINASAIATGLTDPATTTAAIQVVTGTCAEDSTQTKNLVMTGQLENALSTLSITLKNYTVIKFG